MLDKQDALAIIYSLSSYRLRTQITLILDLYKQHIKIFGYNDEFSNTLLKWIIKNNDIKE